MRKRENPRAKVEEEEDKEILETQKEEIDGDDGSKFAINYIIIDDDDDDDDDEANEDLSLKIVEKSLQMRYAKLNQRERAVDVPMSNGAIGGGGVAVDFCGGSSIAEVVVHRAGVACVDEGVSSEVESGRKRKKKVKKVEAAEVKTVIVEGEKMDEAVQSQTGDKVDSTDAKTADVVDNVVLRKLLRGPRYFDPPDSWGTCFNCGEEGHLAVNCSAAKRKKPCFVCGSLDHNAKQCPKGQDCFICKKGGHRAKDCPERGKGGSESLKICLKCGVPGHDMFSCRSDYSEEELKDIQCYVCKKFGHLCCFNTVDTGPRQLSCYKCGQLGHTGLACSRLRFEVTDAGSSATCYRCGEEGHFARECHSSSKVVNRRREPSTSRTLTLEFHREGKHKKASGSAPNDLGKSLKKKKIRTEEKGLTTPRKSNHRGDWMNEHPGDISPVKFKKNKWKSPAQSSIDGTKSGYRRFTASQPPNGRKVYSRTPVRYGSPTVFDHHGYLSRGPANGFHQRNSVPTHSYRFSHHSNPTAQWSANGYYQSNRPPHHRFSASRFDPNFNGTRGNYSWW